MSTSYELEDLQDNTEYTLHAVLVYEDGVKSKAVALTFTTLESDFMNPGFNHIFISILCDTHIAIIS